MELISIILLLLTILCASYFAFNIKIKKTKQMQNNEKLDKLVAKFPENKEVCKQMLGMLNNITTKIKEEEESDSKDSNKKNEGNKKASLYVAISDTIFIANIKDKYYRIQTIAHECLHSVQPKRLLMFNFIYSNIYFIYFVISSILTVIGVFKNIKLQIIILSLLSFLYYVIRSYLETDAMTKAKYLAKDYMYNYIKENPICSKEEVEEILQEYEKINKVGIPTYNFILLFSVLRKIIIFVILILFKTIII